MGALRCGEWLAWGMAWVVFAVWWPVLMIVAPRPLQVGVEVGAEGRLLGSAIRAIRAATQLGPNLRERVWGGGACGTAGHTRLRGRLKHVCIRANIPYCIVHLPTRTVRAGRVGKGTGDCRRHAGVVDASPV